MKDLVSCFSEHAVRISDVACSGAANAAAGAPEAAGGGGGGGGGGCQHESGRGIRRGAQS